MYKFILSLATVAITFVWIAQVDAGCFVDAPRARKQAEVITQEVMKFGEPGHLPQEEGRLVKPGGVWITVRLPVRGYGPDAYDDLAGRMEARGWSAARDRTGVYCKKGTRATVGRGQNGDGGWSMVTTIFDFSGAPPCGCQRPSSS